MCDRQETLVSYLYDEIVDTERRDFEAHLSTCVDCRTELDGLRATRVQLSNWAPPQLDLGFRVIRGGGSAPAPALPRRRFAPAFAFAAAAVILLAVATAIANVEIRYGTDGMTVRTGWAQGAEVEIPAGPAAASLQTASRNDAAGLDGLESRLRQIERALANAPSTANAAAGPDRMSDAEILRRVREIVNDAESRQKEMMMRGLLQVVADFDRQRQADFAMIRQNLGEYQGFTNAELANINHKIRVATGQEK